MSLTRLHSSVFKIHIRGTSLGKSSGSTLSHPVTHHPVRSKTTNLKHISDLSSYYAVLLKITIVHLSLLLASVLLKARGIYSPLSP